MNYYVIEVDGKTAATASSPYDRLKAVEEVAGMLNGTVKIVDKDTFEAIELEDEEL